MWGSKVEQFAQHRFTLAAARIVFVIIVGAVIISIAVAAGSAVAFALRRTTVAAGFCENGSRLSHFDDLVEFTPVEPDFPVRRAIVNLHALAV